MTRMHLDDAVAADAGQLQAAGARREALEPAMRARNDWSLSIIAALAAAAVLVAAGVLMALYQERLYRDQQTRNVRAQAEILAANTAAAILFDDRAATREYVDALRANPDLLGAAIYGGNGGMMAGFARSSLLPAMLSKPQSATGPGYIDIAVPARQSGAQVGVILLRALTEPAEGRFARYAGVILLVGMGVLVIGVLSLTQVQLSRRAKQLVDVNARLQEEMEERHKTEEALRQSHKMEAIGQLSGGIAHDFNNLIMIVKGNLRLLKRRLNEEEGPATTYITAADEALDRAAHLTQRILAFSRRQPLTPQQVNLSILAQGLLELLRHSVGEKVEVVLRLNGSWPTRCDINQMENVILNLAINARDAMPQGGRLILETRDMHFEAPPAALDRQNFVPGDYASLTVIDTGSGMSEEVRLRAVDPFFTTKPQGKGTGLGLSMTFGFVRQSGGHLMIDSAPGRGAAVTVLMPRDRENADQETI
ncbi:MAG TPA: ATP-binding protein [Rhizomicrobium sp.]|nr:ATP-binding protein [Rhizomicrobium sp.]